jgi:transcriptional regulator with XRE-family HTH domain
MKRTPEDAAFAFEFGRELQVKYSEAKTRGLTDDVFAKSIGVARAQLDKYLRGEDMPSVRTVAMAHEAHGISVPYRGVPVSSTLAGPRRRKARSHADQLDLPFTIWADGPGKFDIKLRPISARKFSLQLTIKRTAG